jgi:hypothetical protein
MMRKLGMLLFFLCGGTKLRAGCRRPLPRLTEPSPTFLLPPNNSSRATPFVTLSPKKKKSFRRAKVAATSTLIRNVPCANVRPPSCSFASGSNPVTRDEDSELIFGAIASVRLSGVTRQGIRCSMCFIEFDKREDAEQVWISSLHFNINHCANDNRFIHRLTSKCKTS